MTEHDAIKCRLSDFAVGALRGRQQARVRQHLRACAECQAELAALQQTGVLLGSMAFEDAPADTWEKVQREMVRRTRRRVRPLVRWAYGLAAGALAVALVLLGSFVLRPGATGDLTLLPIADADQEMQATIEGHLSTEWDAPLADAAAVGLRLAEWEDDG